MSFHTGSLFYVEKYESRWAVHQNKDKSEHLQKASVFSKRWKRNVLQRILTLGKGRIIVLVDFKTYFDELSSRNLFFFL